MKVKNTSYLKKSSFDTSNLMEVNNTSYSKEVQFNHPQFNESHNASYLKEAQLNDLQFNESQQNCGTIKTKNKNITNLFLNCLLNSSIISHYYCRYVMEVQF